MAKRKKVHFEPISEDEPEPEPEPQTPRKRSTPSRDIRPPLYKASVKELAETRETESTSSTADVDNAVIQRIKNCLARARHPTTPEAEAKIAVHMASKIMGRYNLSRVEVFKHEPPSNHEEFAGASVISITRTDGDESKPIRNQYYVGTLAISMTNFFECKTLKNASRFFLEYTFYGITANTVGAAMAFEMAYNFIAEWARRLKGTASMNSYCHGVADELWRMSQEKKKSEEKEAMEAESEAIAAKEKAEEAQRLEQLARLADLPPLSDHDSSGDEDWHDTAELQDADDGGDTCDEADFRADDGEDVNPFADFEEEMQKFAKLVRKTPDRSSELADEAESETSDAETGTASSWSSCHDLVTFRNTAANVADEWAKKKGKKLRKGRKNKTKILDWQAYKKGVEDSKKIDVHRRRIEEGRNSANKTLEADHSR